jgi:hypothetical protein
VSSAPHIHTYTYTHTYIHTGMSIALPSVWCAGCLQDAPQEEYTGALRASDSTGDVPLDAQAGRPLLCRACRAQESVRGGSSVEVGAKEGKGKEVCNSIVDELNHHTQIAFIFCTTTQ